MRTSFLPFRQACGVAFLRLLAVFSLVASGHSLFAATVTQSNITYTYTVGVATAAVSGNTSASGAITIPSTITVDGATYNVTSILGGVNGFFVAWAGLQGNSTITSITISNGVTSIANHAFAACTNLVSVTLPSSLTSIGVEAFRGCTRLVSVTIPDSVTSFPGGAFQDCTNLASVTLPSGLTSLGG